MMKPDVTPFLTKCSYCVPLTEEQFDALTTLNLHCDEVYSVCPGDEHPAIKRMMDAGVDRIEWNGHFGRNFFFECDAEKVDSATKAVKLFFSRMRRCTDKTVLSDAAKNRKKQVDKDARKQ